MAADIALNVSGAKVGPSAYQETSFKTYLGQKLDPMDFSRRGSKYIKGERVSCTFREHTLREKVGPIAYQQQRSKTHPGPKLDPVHISRHRPKHMWGQS